MFEYIIAALSPFMGLFFSLRLNAFLYQWVGVSYSAWLHVLISILFFALAYVFRNKLAYFLKQYTYGLRPASVTVYALSVVGSYFLRSILIYSALEGTEITNAFVLIASILGCGVFLGLFILLTANVIQNSLLLSIKKIRRLRRRDVIYMLFLLVLLNFVTWLYIHFSGTVYYWDNAGYWTITHSMADTARTGLFPLFKDVYNSIMTSDYNYIIALPGTVLCMIFGKSRYVFVSGIINIYVFPLFVLLFLYIRQRYERYIVITTAVILATPSIVYLSLVGFVDVAGIIPCFLAALFYLRGKRGQPGDYIIAGCLLALAVLLRRWYVFFALSLLICSLLDSIIYRRSPVPVLATVLSMAFILLFFFQKFVSLRLLADYRNMYSAYQMGLKTDFMIFFRYFGVIPTLGVIAFAIYRLAGKRQRRETLFMLLQPVVCFILFISIQTHGQQHLLLYAPAFLWFYTRIFAAFISREQKPGPVFATGAAVSILLTSYCIVPRPQPASIQEIISPALIPNFTFKPATRPDIDDLLHLTEYMDSLVAGTEKHMAVLSSSLTLNRSVLTNVEISLSLEGCDDIDRSYLLDLPSVDSRDGLPLGVEEWDYVLVASPLQTHLGEENQRVVTTPAESFLNATDIALAYEKLPEQFTLSGSDIKIHIFERKRDITEDEYDSYVEKLRELLPEKF